MTAWNRSRTTVDFPGLEPIEPGTRKCPIMMARNTPNEPNRNIAAKIADGNLPHEAIEPGIEAVTVGETAATVMMAVSIAKIVFADHVIGGILTIRLLLGRTGRIDANRRLDRLPRPGRVAFATWMGITNSFHPGPTNAILRRAVTRKNPVRTPSTAADSPASLIRWTSTMIERISRSSSIFSPRLNARSFGMKRRPYAERTNGWHGSRRRGSGSRIRRG